MDRSIASDRLFDKIKKRDEEIRMQYFNITKSKGRSRRKKSAFDLDNLTLDDSSIRKSTEKKK
jgi:hypothetical protein